MTLSSFSSIASATPTQINVDYELVRGSEARIISELLPRVRQESVALDLSGVERIDAAGIAALITLYCSSVEAGTNFSVVAPSAHVLDLLKLVGLGPILLASSAAARASRTCYTCPAA